MGHFPSASHHFLLAEANKLYPFANNKRGQFITGIGRHWMQDWNLSNFMVYKSFLPAKRDVPGKSCLSQKVYYLTNKRAWHGSFVSSHFCLMVTDFPRNKARQIIPQLNWLRKWYKNNKTPFNLTSNTCLLCFLKWPKIP